MFLKWLKIIVGLILAGVGFMLTESGSDWSMVFVVLGGLLTFGALREKNEK